MVLKVTDLTKSFGGLTAVDNVSFEIPERHILGLIGPNGAGKTTIFNLITGVYGITSGDISYFGKSIQGLRRHMLFRNKLVRQTTPPYKIAQMGITRTFQNIRLFKKLTVYENIFTACHRNTQYNLGEALLFGVIPEKFAPNSRYHRQERNVREETEHLLEIMGLTNRRDILANNLPYGLQRRLEIARAVALYPKLLLLDEPAAGMNPDETHRLGELIKQIRSEFNLTVLLIEHHMDLVMEICDHIVVLNFGAKIAEGSAAGIQNDRLVQEAYLGEDADA